MANQNQEELPASLHMSPLYDTKTDGAEARVVVCQVVGAYPGQAIKPMDPQGPFQSGEAAGFSLLPKGGVPVCLTANLPIYVSAPSIQSSSCVVKTQ